eukprot:2155231-Prymnesium_polylepis.1
MSTGTCLTIESCCSLVDSVLSLDMFEVVDRPVGVTTYEIASRARDGRSRRGSAGRKCTKRCCTCSHYRPNLQGVWGYVGHA